MNQNLSLAKNTSWKSVAPWYSSLVGKKGHYFHQHVVIPQVLRLLHLKENSRVLDLACGEGILSRNLPPAIEYLGIDSASNFIKEAISKDKNSHHSYITSDVTKPLPIKQNAYTHATIILSLQNIQNAEAVLHNIKRHLSPDGKLAIVLNHPCFRIPRQSSWEIDEANKLQYRRINRYLSPLEIPISIEPAKGEKSKLTWSFHEPLSYYSDILFKNNFVIERLEEWASDRESEGYYAKMENRARAEIPLFMGILARRAN